MHCLSLFFAELENIVEKYPDLAVREISSYILKNKTNEETPTSPSHPADLSDYSNTYSSFQNQKSAETGILHHRMPCTYLQYVLQVEWCN